MSGLSKVVSETFSETRSLDISRRQFATFRVLFGSYLAVHFFSLVGSGAELWSRQGVFPDSSVFPIHGLFPNPLDRWDSPAAITGVLVALGLGALGFALGFKRRILAVVLWFGLACLFNRNVLIANPSLPYVGLLLLLTACVPEGEGAGLHRRRDDWRFPPTAYVAAWVLLMVGYTYSGVVKLGAPSWVDGSAIRHLLENPLARPTALREFLLGLPPVLLQVATWGGLALEILAAPLAIVPRLRLWVWLALIGMQLGILGLVSFADLTFGMLCAHLFTFDPRWLRPRPSLAGRHLVLYDGVCGMCDHSVQILLEEDRARVLNFAANQGTTRAEIERRRQLPAADATLVLLRDCGTPDERMFQRADGPLEIARLVGGWLAALAVLGRIVPRPIRNRAYDFIAKRRFRWFGRLDACRIPSPETRALFLD